MATIKTILLLWPFDLATTLWLAFFIYQCAVMVVKNQWGKLREYAYHEAFKFFLFNLEKNTKLRAVVEGLRQHLPPMIQPFVSDQKLVELVDGVYQQRVKPEAKRLGLDKVQKLDPGSDTLGGLFPALAGLQKLSGQVLSPEISQQVNSAISLASQSAQTAAALNGSQHQGQALAASPPAEHKKTGLFNF